jgi:hypothetical protein
VRERSCHSCGTFDFLTKPPLHQVRGTQPAPVTARKREHRQPFSYVGFQPPAQPRSTRLVPLRQQLQSTFRLRSVRRVDGGTQILSHPGRISIRGTNAVSLHSRTKLTPCPGHARKLTGQRGSQPRMVIADDQLYPVQPAGW